MTPTLRGLPAAMIACTLACSLLLRSVAAEDAQDQRFAVAARLDSALRDAGRQDQPERQIAVLEAAAAEALLAMTANVLMQETLRKVEQSASRDPRQSANQWRNAVTEARDILSFKPLIEAPLPVGFPEPTPVGEIRVQQYPVYRLAQTDMTLLEGRAFWTLFNHIKQREIAMTAPVEMGYSSQKNGALGKSSMSFLYRSTEQGRLETDGKVAVVDVPAQSAVSIGLRGDATTQRVNDAKVRLENWLHAHRDEYQAAGPLRVMAYNSPFVADQKKFIEVQIPVTPSK